MRVLHMGGSDVIGTDLSVHHRVFVPSNILLDSVRASLKLEACVCIASDSRCTHGYILCKH